MTRVKILRRFPYSPDGLRVETWAEGSERDVPDSVLRLLIDEGACEILENKALAGAPENKAAPKRRARKARK